MANPTPVAEIKLDERDLKKLEKAVPEKVERGVRKTAALIEAKAYQIGVKMGIDDTSNLLNSGTTEIEGRGYHTSAMIKFRGKNELGDEYALYVHEGTGIFGPKKRPIKPVNAKALMIPLPDGGVIFRKSVKGMKARPFLKEAFEIEGPKLVPRILE